MRYIPKYQRSGVLQKLGQAEDANKPTITNPMDISEIVTMAEKKKEYGTISNETKSNLEKGIITTGMKIIKKLDRDILPPLALAGMFSPVTRLASQAYLVNKLESNNISAEAVNTAHSRLKNNYISEAAGGLVDAKQAWEELRKGNFLYKDGKFGAIPQAIWAISGVVEPKSGIPNVIDNSIEKSKAIGDFSDITLPIVNKVINPLYSEALKVYIDSKNPKKQLAQEKTVENHKKGGTIEDLIVKNQKGKTLPILKEFNPLQDGTQMQFAVNPIEAQNIIKIARDKKSAQEKMQPPVSLVPEYERIMTNIKNVGNTLAGVVKPIVQAGAVASAAAMAAPQVINLGTVGLKPVLGTTVKGILGGASVDYLYNRIGGKLPGDILGINNPVGKFVANSISPGMLAGVNTVTFYKKPKLSYNDAKQILKPSDNASLENLSRAFEKEESKEITEILNRMKSLSYGDTQALKKSRMLARNVPNYDETFNYLSAKEDYPGDDIFDLRFPTENQYRKRIKYTPVEVDNLVDESYYSPGQDFINLGLHDDNNLDISGFHLGSVYNHELDHAISLPTLQDFAEYKKIFDLTNTTKYYKNNLGTEIKARLGQIKDLLGKSGREQVTKEELENALIVMKDESKYPLQNFLDNSIDGSGKMHFLDRIKDKEALLKLLNDATHNPFLSAMGITGITTPLLNKSAKTQKPIKYNMTKNQLGGKLLSRLFQDLKVIYPDPKQPQSNFIKDKVNSLQNGGKLNNIQEILNIIKEIWKK